MRKLKFALALVCLSLILAACSQPSPQPGEETASPQPTSAPATVVPKGADTGNGSGGETAVPGDKVPAPVLQARQALAAELGVAPNTIQILSFAEAQWPDTCLGLPRPDEMCAEVITEGYGGAFQAGGEQWEFRVDLSGEITRFVPSAEQPVSQVLTWRREGGIAGFCDDLSVYLNGEVVAATCQGNTPEDQARTRLTDEQLQQVLTWVDTYKSFEINQTDQATADAMTIILVFSGAGEGEPGQAEKDAILDFAQKLYTGIEQNPETFPPNSDPEAARQALTAYFEALRRGDWAKIIELYGGSYEWLQGNNPGVSPDDYPGLFAAGCRYNGLLCGLQPGRFIKGEVISPTEFKFTLEFTNPDGSLFKLGPCCGEEGASPVTQFEYTIIRSGDQFLVQELPVYVP
jgi:hypothetical protein